MSGTGAQQLYGTLLSALHRATTQAGADKQRNALLRTNIKGKH